jgi:AI-2 transport protein TqsA
MSTSNVALHLSPLLHTLLIAACAVVILAGMRAIAGILNAFLLAILIATICLPLENWLRCKGLSRGLAFILTLLVIVLVGVSAVLFLVFSILQVIDDLPQYQGHLQTYLDTLKTQFDRLGMTSGGFSEVTGSSSQEIIRLSVQVLRSVVSALSAVLLMYLFLFYLLLEGQGFSQRLHSALGASNPSLMKLTEFTTNTRRYLVLRTVFGAGIAVTQTVIMVLFGVDFALLWGFLSFICNYIPNVGFIFGLIPPALMLFFEQGPVLTILLIILYSLSNNLIEYFVAPKFIGVKINLSPLSVAVSLVFWTWVLGPLGAILALPMTLFVKGVLLETDSRTKLLVALMSASSQPHETHRDLSDENEPSAQAES